MWAQAREYMLTALALFAEFSDEYRLGITLRSLARHAQRAATAR